MKYSLSTIAKQFTLTLALVVLIIGPFQPLIAQAQTALTAQQQQQYSTCLANNAGDSTFCTQSVTNQTINANGSTVQNPVSNVPTSNCALASGGTVFKSGDWAQCITDVIYVFTIGIGSGFAYVSAYFFDWAVSLSLNGSAYALDFVSSGWTTARDLANMAFLFILLYIAFKIIFSAETGDTIHMLALVIVVALLVNFSFFFTRLAIDAGNILSIQFYNAINVQSLAATAQQGGVSGNVLATLSTVGNATTGANIAGQTKDLTANIMGMLNLQGLLGSDSFNQFRNSASYNFLTAFISLTFLYIAAAIMLWGLTVAFITNGVKFLIRIVVLWFLIIASPLAFVAKAVPAFSKYYDRWQDELIKHAFYPAAFMFIFLILNNFAVQMSGQNGLLTGIFGGISQTPSNTGYVAQMAIVIANVGIRMGFVLAMLYIGMRAAGEIGVMGASAAKSAGNWAGGKLIGTYGAAGRYTLGFGAQTAARSNLLRNWASNDAVIGRNLWRGARGLAGASFDARGVSGLGGVLKDAGKAQKGGYKADFDARVKGRREDAEALEPSRGQVQRARELAEQEYRAATEQAQRNIQTSGLGVNAATQAHGQAEQAAQQATQAQTRAQQAETRAAQALQNAMQETQNLIATGVGRGTPEMQQALRTQQTAQTAHQIAQAANTQAQLQLQTAQQAHTAARTTLTDARVELARSNAELENTQRDQAARQNEISGADFHTQYADSLTTYGLGNLWHIPTAGFVTKSMRDASAYIRRGKSDNDRLLDAIRGIQAGGGGH